MTASDHLSRAQFYPIEQIGGLKSQIPGLSVEQSYYTTPTRWDETEQHYAQAKGYGSAHEYHEALKSHIREHGVAVPVAFDRRGSLMNGHHRYYAARDLGLTHIPAERLDPRNTSPVPDVPWWDR